MGEIDRPGGHAQEPASPHPVRLVVTDDLRRNRLTVLFRLLLAIPHAVWLGLFGIAAFVVAVGAWAVGVATGTVPPGMQRLLVAYTRYSTQVYAYLYLAADPYPGFAGAPGYPVDVAIEPAAVQRRITILVRLLLAIPAFVVVWVLHQVAQIVAFLGWFYALFTGRMSKGMRDLQCYVLRYNAQTTAYVLLCTERYPSFSDE